MKTSHIIITAALAAFSSITSMASAKAVDFFVRPVVGIIAPTDEDYDSEKIFGLSAGVYLGSTKAHEFSLEISSAQWNDSGTSGGITANVEETAMPVLLNYRYYVPVKDDKVRFYMGPSLGMTHYRTDLSGSGFGVRVSDSADEWFATLSVATGFVFQINEKIDVDAGYRFINIQEREFELFGQNLDLKNLEAHVFYAGLSYRF